MRLRKLVPLPLLLCLPLLGRADEKQRQVTTTLDRQHSFATKLPEPSRSLLRTTMRWHAADLNDVVTSVVELDYAAAGIRARLIANDPSISRPLVGPAKRLSSELPEQFFVLQDRLKRASSELAEAADRQDPTASAQALGRMTTACVQCHALFDLRKQAKAPLP